MSGRVVSPEDRPRPGAFMISPGTPARPHTSTPQVTTSGRQRRAAPAATASARQTTVRIWAGPSNRPKSAASATTAARWARCNRPSSIGAAG